MNQKIEAIKTNIKKAWNSELCQGVITVAATIVVGSVVIAGTQLMSIGLTNFVSDKLLSKPAEETETPAVVEGEVIEG